ncbi:MAG: AAA family ATPase, partial [Planctomycetes bacterium]|nr:AAA family ATPase [Planctomycetota bacterium]
PSEATDHLLAAYLCGIHVLLEGPPGVGKTTLACQLGRLAGGMGRVQMSSDMQPSDLIGSEIYDSAQPDRPRFRKGPLFSPVLLVDEINRAMPRTQSALLQAMEENKVTVGEEELSLDPFFFVIATQNPHDLEGTYLLPRSQIDRFGLRISIAGPRGDELEAILGLHLAGVRASQNQEQILFDLPRMREELAELSFDGEWMRVAARLQDELAEGGGQCLLSPRAWLHWLELGRALSFVRGHKHLSAACLRELLCPVFAHRLDDEGLALELPRRFDALTSRA